jgi:hypothetical protein
VTRAVIAVAALVAVCGCTHCGSQPKLPGGLPPEYEPGRAFELPAQPSAAPSAAPSASSSAAPSVAPPAKPKPTE